MNDGNADADINTVVSHGNRQAIRYKYVKTTLLTYCTQVRATIATQLKKKPTTYLLCGIYRILMRNSMSGNAVFYKLHITLEEKYDKKKTVLYINRLGKSLAKHAP